jgi:hypothetical protein
MSTGQKTGAFCFVKGDPMSTEVIAIRLTASQRAALEAAAAGSGTKPRTLAQRWIEAGLQRGGFLPKTSRAAARRVKAE